jgi:lipopolysaccharide/colanic/teichoic acid biosynthesis glycosyltransferase
MALCYNLPSVTPGTTPREEWAQRHVLDHRLFRGVLIRERKRADRSHQSVVLIRLELSRDAAAEASRLWPAAVDVVLAVAAETDVVGWLDPGAAIGVLVCDMPPSEGVRRLHALAAGIGADLATRVSTAAAAQFTMHLHVYPEAKPEPAPGGAIDPLFYPELLGTRRRRWSYDALKRVLDVIGSVLLLVALSPLVALIAVLVKLGSPGPVFFRQQRIGYMMKPFTMLKFRTMHVDADPKVHQEFVSQFIRASLNLDDFATSVFKLTRDPRVTPIGRLLRKTSLDELPQIWNVLRGEMSLIGPRPPLPYEFVEYKPWHRRRLLEARPGITGLWQVAGRSRTTFDEMVRLDLHYARRRSLWMDVRIFLATPAAVISGKGAC